MNLKSLGLLSTNSCYKAKATEKFHNKQTNRNKSIENVTLMVIVITRIQFYDRLVPHYFQREINRTLTFLNIFLNI